MLDLCTTAWQVRIGSLCRFNSRSTGIIGLVAAEASVVETEASVPILALLHGCTPAVDRHTTAPCGYVQTNAIWATDVYMCVRAQADDLKMVCLSSTGMCKSCQRSRSLQHPPSCESRSLP